MKTLLRKFYNIRYLYKSQKFCVFYNNKNIKQATSTLNKNIRKIQIYNLLYIKKNNNKTDVFSRRLDLIKKKQKIYSLLKLYFDDQIIKRICQLNTIFIIKQNNLKMQYINGKK